MTVRTPRSPLRRWLVGGAGVALMVTALVGLAAPPALACSCVGWSAEEAREAADVVFTGQIVDRDESAGSVAYAAQVDQVYKGDVGTTVELVTSDNEASCGLVLPVGEPAFVFASAKPSVIGPALAGGQLEVNLCNGTTPGTGAPTAWGSGLPPTGAVEAAPAVDAAPAADPGDGDSTRSTLLAVVLGLAIGATVGLWWVARRRARPDEVDPDSPGSGEPASRESGPSDPRAGPSGSDHRSDPPS